MIVSKDEARRIIQARKTTHRIPVQAGEACRYQPHRDYAISVMGDRPEQELYGFTSTIAATGKTRRRRQRVARQVCRVRVTDVRQERLGDMTVTDARAEGYRTTSDYYASLRDLRSITPDPDLQVWVLEFHLLRETDDKVRLLHRRSEYGYTTDYRSSLPDEPEAVDEVTAARFAREAYDRDDELRRERAAWIASLPASERMHVLAEEARARRVDISHHERVIEDRLDRIQRQLNGDGRAA